MSIWLPYIPSFILGISLFMFYYWRRLKEDYVHDLIFTSLGYIFVGVSLGGLVSFLLSRILIAVPFLNAGQLWFWGAFLGWVLAVVANVKLLKFKFFETFEASSIGLLIWLEMLYIANFISTQVVSSLGMSVFVFFLFILFRIFEKKYKQFSWYKSGKVGFSGLISLGIYFSARAVLALISINMVTLAGKIEVIFSTVTAFLLFFAVYYLSEQ